MSGRRRLHADTLPSIAQLVTLSALSKQSALPHRLAAPWEPVKHVYGGTVPPEVVANRRAANKRARHSRRINRGRR